jgi:TolB protein
MQDGNPALPPLPGFIAYVGRDQNIYTLNLQTSVISELTTDASLTQTYRWPTWSTDGRLAYFSIAGTSERFSTQVFIASDHETPGQLVYSGTGEIFNYAYWSPQNCNDDERCRDLAVLLSSELQEGLFVQLIRDRADEDTNQTIGRGSPFYYSWSPDGTRMLWQRLNRRLDVYNVSEGAIIQSFEQRPGVFQAPDWSPVDDRLLVGVLSDDGRSTDLAILANNASPWVLAKALNGPVAFAWSPDGNHIAYTDRQGPLIVLDTTTGETVARSSTTGTLAFFWSPDSTSLAYVTLANPPSSFSASTFQSGRVAAPAYQATGLAWSVLNVKNGTNRRYGAFIPTRDMLYLLAYFDQFAQSHSVWSPDSQYVIYAEIAQNGLPIISLLNMTQLDTVPFAIAEGTIGVWSFK